MCLIALNPCGAETAEDTVAADGFAAGGASNPSPTAPHNRAAPNNGMT